ncbi:MAG: hypothetical protein JST16_10760 [Bdellovibrionales bacterium]|nr:hypothetical protein [Bdellovibrionales bacterium]
MEKFALFKANKNLRSDRLGLSYRRSDERGCEYKKSFIHGSTVAQSPALRD